MLSPFPRFDIALKICSYFRSNARRSLWSFSGTSLTCLFVQQVFVKLPMESVATGELQTESVSGTAIHLINRRWGIAWAPGCGLCIPSRDVGSTRKTEE